MHEFDIALCARKNKGKNNLGQKWGKGRWGRVRVCVCERECTCGGKKKGGGGGGDSDSVRYKCLFFKTSFVTHGVTIIFFNVLFLLLFLLLLLFL